MHVTVFSSFDQSFDRLMGKKCAKCATYFSGKGTMCGSCRNNSSRKGEAQHLQTPSALLAPPPPLSGSTATAPTAELTPPLAGNPVLHSVASQAAVAPLLPCRQQHRRSAIDQCINITYHCARWQLHCGSQTDQKVQEQDPRLRQ